MNAPPHEKNAEKNLKTANIKSKNREEKNGRTQS